MSKKKRKSTLDAIRILEQTGLSEAQAEAIVDYVDSQTIQIGDLTVAVNKIIAVIVVSITTAVAILIDVLK